LIVVAGLAIITTIAGVAGVIGAYYFVAPGLPAAQTIRDIPLQIPLRIFSRDGYLVEEIGQRRRILIQWYRLPRHSARVVPAAGDR
jgi:penicillin-binding protein 1A